MGILGYEPGTHVTSRAGACRDVTGQVEFVL